MKNDLTKAIQKLSYKKQLYVKFKHDLFFESDKKITEEDVLKKCQLKTFDTFLRWEKSSEYLHIVSLILESKAANDLLEIYEKVKAKVSGNDPNYKDIEMMLKLSKEIKSHAALAKNHFNNTEEEEDDDLEL